MTKNAVQSGELLRQAIKSEIDGQRFYTFLAGKATNEEARRKLSNLAQDEVRHEAALKQIYREIFGEEVSDIPKRGLGVLSKFFENPEGRVGMNEIQYIDLAIEAELAATAFYKKGAQDAPTDEIKETYEGMAAEEFNHYELLQAEKAALSGSYYWFAYGDDAPMED